MPTDWPAQELAGLLSEAEWTAARRTTINAHYTSAEVVTHLWSTVQQIGFDPDDARVLEPGSGSGNFLGFAPAGVRLTGIELDPTTAAISAALYPHATIRAESFADTKLPDGSFDLVIGNVPFGAVVLNDRAHNPHRHSIHNHFIIKSLDLVRPGGLVAVVTSRFTLDAAGEAARADMAARADLVGAVRLPAGTFRAAAGTDVITDVLVLRRRLPGAEPAGAAWQSVTTVDTPDGPTDINEYFAAHPDMVAGDLRLVNGQYHADDLNVVANPAKPIGERFAHLAATAAAENLTYTPAPRRSPVTGSPAGTGERDRLGGRVRKEGSIVATGAATFARVVAGELEPINPPKKVIPELRALTALRDTMVELLDVQARSDNDAAFADLQAQLGTLYDRYVAGHGPLGRFQMVRTGRTDPDTGNETERRLYPVMGGFRRDPDFPSMLALETYDPETGTATKAAIFSTRVVGSRAGPGPAPIPRRRRWPSLSTRPAASTWTASASLLGVDPDSARHALGSLVWDDPAGGPAQTAQRYLSGNVRTKLAAAQAAAAIDARFEANVAALTAVQPDDLTPGEIDARPGATWIPPSDVAAFLAETFEGAKAIVEHTPIDASWALQVPTWQRTSLLMTSTWGTKRADAITLFAKALNQQQHQVYDTDADGRRILNSEETLLAQEKQQLLSDRFAKWVWEDPERSARLAARYNELFNSHRPARLGRLPPDLPRPVAQFQAPTATRSTPSGGPCKNRRCSSATSSAPARPPPWSWPSWRCADSGWSTKPAMAVPNHMLEQFTSRVPPAVPPSQSPHGHRRGDPPRSPQRVRGPLRHRRLGRHHHDPLGVREDPRLRRNRGQLPRQRDRRLPRRHRGVGRRQPPVGQATRNRGAQERRTPQSSARRHPPRRRRHLRGRPASTTSASTRPTCSRTCPSRPASKASAAAKPNGPPTWTSNSNTSGPATAGGPPSSPPPPSSPTPSPRCGSCSTTSNPTCWPRRASTTSTRGPPPSGAPSRLSNCPPTATPIGSRTASPHSPTSPSCSPCSGPSPMSRPTTSSACPPPTWPAAATKPSSSPASANLRLYTKSLADRASKLGRDTESAKVDNMLKITGDGRKAALDLRLVGVRPDPTGGKIAVAASHIAAIYHQHKHRPYPAAGARPGALQLVFCDLSTPSPGWNAYQELKDRLVGHGVPADAVRFVHDGSGDRQKADLFAQARSGAIAVLVGSTAKMGVGTNVQARAIALHHIDAPWRPADMDQRDGRIRRQGNLNDTVTIKRYVTEGSFDTFMYQTLERKSRFINQVCRGELDIARTIDDVGEATLSLAEVKALSTGNPLIMEKAGSTTTSPASNASPPVTPARPAEPPKSSPTATSASPACKPA